MTDFWPIRWLLDAVIVFTVLEGVGLWLYHRISGRGLAPREYALNMLSGLCLMLAVRAALGGLAWPWVAVCLSASGVAHGWDIVKRWQRQRPTQAVVSRPS
ncbi:MAG: hypothetical protein QUV35_03200 [Hydrogenophaga sp.]|uniref:hypothetical protein n=1 Tax=Hydrogenophaga sp. TaxID=1904254 RepID=UPI0026177CBC|nr:hypothetical protein [Hydrogenophaga sp.]MDM7941614.1 hypothetical protein [Hydrogenophaga sp.]